MVTYAIHNTVRARHTRSQRAQGVVRGMKQYVTGSQQRLVRGRPVVISEETLLASLAELKEKGAAGLLEVRTMDGRLVDLSSLQPNAPADVVEAAVVDALPEPPLPNPPLDSVANDKPAGIPMGVFQGGPIRQDKPSEAPTVAPPADEESETPNMPEEQEWTEGQAAAVPEPTAHSRRRRR